jgi:hypothetical protein
LFRIKKTIQNEYNKAKVTETIITIIELSCLFIYLNADSTDAILIIKQARGRAITITRRMFLAANTSTSVQTTLAPDAHVAEGQFLYEELTLNKAK